MRYTPRLVAVIEELDLRRGNVYEHTPLDYYRYGEYPRFIRPVDAHQPRVRVVWEKEPRIECGVTGGPGPGEETTAMDRHMI